MQGTTMQTDVTSAWTWARRWGLRMGLSRGPAGGRVSRVSVYGHGVAANHQVAYVTRVYAMKNSLKSRFSTVPPQVVLPSNRLQGPRSLGHGQRPKRTNVLRTSTRANTHRRAAAGATMRSMSLLYTLGTFLGPIVW